MLFRSKSGGGSDTISDIVVLISIITILSALSLEPTVKGVLALTLSVAAIFFAYPTVPQKARGLESIQLPDGSPTLKSGRSRKSRSSATRLMTGSVVAGAIIAITVAVLLSVLTNQLLSNLK